jgi:hypothetical protein
MSPEERQLLAGLFERTKAAAVTPRDQEAETFINEQIKAQPAAAYLLAQTVIVQDQALQGANQRLEQLESRNRELEAQAQRPASGGFLGGLFGAGAARQAPPPPPRGDGQAQGGPWGAQPQQPNFAAQGYTPQVPQPPAGGSFLKGALGAAAGVAGGVLLADGIRSLFHGGGAGGLGIGSGHEHAGGDTVVNNFYGEAAPDSDTQEAGYDDSYDDSPDVQDADYGDDGGFDSGGDGGFDV